MSDGTSDEKPKSFASNPEGWTDEPLSKFLDDAHHNMLATFVNLRPQYDALATIDRLYCDMIGNLNQTPEFVAGFFLIRTHSSFRAAVRLALSGQIPETYMVLRGCVESALYGLYLVGDINRQEIWLQRHVDDASMKRVKAEFTVRNVMNKLQSVDSKTHEIAQRLYDQTIDLGGHPNERAISTQIKTESTDSQVNFSADYFNCGDLPHQLALKTAARAGICCLDIFFHVYRDRFRILSINHRLDQLRRGF